MRSKNVSKRSADLAILDEGEIFGEDDIIL